MIAGAIRSTSMTMNLVAIPRYVRVNTLKTSVDVVIQQFGEQGWIMRPSISDLRYTATTLTF
jgi:16S rRNA C967 or C1407 C5-methylase (RsmB/RsmF family)